MKNGLVRVQCYLTTEAYRELMTELDRLNEQRDESKLSESSFYCLKLTGTEPRRRGAPRGNKNAAGGKRKSSSEITNHSSIKETSEEIRDEILQKYSAENITNEYQTAPDNFEDAGDAELATASSEETAVSDSVDVLSSGKELMFDDDFLEEAFFTLDRLIETNYVINEEKMEEDSASPDDRETSRNDSQTLSPMISGEQPSLF